MGVHRTVQFACFIFLPEIFFVSCSAEPQIAGKNEGKNRQFENWNLKAKWKYCRRGKIEAIVGIFLWQFSSNEVNEFIYLSLVKNSAWIFNFSCIFYILIENNIHYNNELLTAQNVKWSFI